jgi:hypothetical protein
VLGCTSPWHASLITSRSRVFLGMKLVSPSLFAILALVLTCFQAIGKKFLHERPNQHKALPGWQEPGLWRPKWVLEREFEATPTAPAYTDRLYIKLKPDRTVSICNSRKRPWLQWGTRSATKSDPAKKSLFENDISNSDKARNSAPPDESLESIYSADGTWSFTDEAPMPTGRITIETKERQADGTTTRIRHESRCDWGVLDDYAVRFWPGRVYRYKGVQRNSDLPVGKYAAGSFILKANAQRPLISKDFQAFQ